jgi:methanogenic corrinoid protein MtbC1
VRAPSDPIGARSASYLDALLRHDAATAARIVDEALVDGAAVDEIYLRILQPALYDVGHRWAMGELDVAEEHYTTAVTQQVLERLSARMRVPPHDGRLAVVSGTPGELHAVGPRMVSDFLEADGWEVLLLGAATPAADLVALVDREQPDLVALSTTTAGSIAGVEEALGLLRRLAPAPLIAVGGQLWTAEASRSAQELGADVVTCDARELVAIARKRIPRHPD